MPGKSNRTTKANRQRSETQVSYWPPLRCFSTKSLVEHSHNGSACKRLRWKKIRGSKGTHARAEESGLVERTDFQNRARTTFLRQHSISGNKKRRGAKRQGRSSGLASLKLEQRVNVVHGRDFSFHLMKAARWLLFANKGMVAREKQPRLI